MKTFRVPVIADIQIFKHVEVSAATENEAVAAVQRRLKLVGVVEDDHPDVAGLTVASIEEAIDEMRGPRTPEKDLTWVPGLVYDFKLGVKIDQDRVALEVHRNRARLDESIDPYEVHVGRAIN